MRRTGFQNYSVCLANNRISRPAKVHANVSSMKSLRKEARGRDCMVRIPRICNFNSETTVGAHLGGGGMGAKKHDLHIAWCCSACHDALDGRVRTQFSKDELKLMHLDGVIRTQEALIKEGKI